MDYYITRQVNTAVNNLQYDLSRINNARTARDVAVIMNHSGVGGPLASMMRSMPEVRSAQQSLQSQAKKKMMSFSENVQCRQKMMQLHEYARGWCPELSQHFYRQACMLEHH